MAAGDTSGRFLDVRPILTRARSSSSPITKRDPADITMPVESTTRPSHIRSRSYVSPVEQKKRDSTATIANSTTSEKVSEPSRFRRLHLHGKHHHTLSEEHKPVPQQKRHRYTQSEAQQYHGHERGSHNEGKPFSSHVPYNQNPSILYPYHASRGAAIPSLSRMASYRSAAGTAGDALFYGATMGDTRVPNQDGMMVNNNPPRKKTSIEKLIDAASLNSPRSVLFSSPSNKSASNKQITKSDIEKLNTQLATAKQELTTRLSTTSRTASNLMRRLDEAHDTLHRTAESLIDTLSSFTNLSQQSAKLISNFETEASNLDSSLHKRILYFRNHICSKRAQRIDELERRGRDVSSKAEELGRRLENCRVIVQNWEERELNKRKAWKGVWNGLFWGFVLIFVGILAGVASWKAVERKGLSLNMDMINTSIVSGGTSGDSNAKSNDVGVGVGAGIVNTMAEKLGNVTGLEYLKNDHDMDKNDDNYNNDGNNKNGIGNWIPSFSRANSKENEDEKPKGKEEKRLGSKLEGSNVPEDIQRILIDIAVRKDQGKGLGLGLGLGMEIDGPDSDADGGGGNNGNEKKMAKLERELRLLDEL